MSTIEKKKPAGNNFEIKDFLDNFEIIDLTHEINNDPPCTLLPLAYNIVHAQEDTGESVGVTFRTTRLNNLHLNHGTHIDFPGHVRDIKTTKKVGDYTIDKFIAETIVIDVSEKIDGIKCFFHMHGPDQGHLDASKFGTGDDFINKLLKLFSGLEIKMDEFKALIGQNELSGKGLILYTGLSKYWQKKIFNGWQYLYFVNPYFSDDVIDIIVESGVRFIGIDALQIENPIINLSGKEFELVATAGLSNLIKSKLENISINLAHRKLLQNEILIIENMTNVNKIVGRKTILVAAPPRFSLSSCTDNSIARVFAMCVKP